MSIGGELILIFNRWRKYPRKEPKNEGWYQCTVLHGYGLNEPRVMDLYFSFAPDIGGIWIDRRRQQVFYGYKVYKPSRAPIEDNRLWKDELCERIDVVAWRKLPKVYRIGRLYKNE